MNITAYLKKHDIPQNRFAEMLDVSAGMVNQWVSGYRPVSPEKSVIIEQITKGEVSRKDLHPNTWRGIWPELKDVA
jgi:DNA-binding transcriptional regulator YdaS (Cro superfamily)